MKKFIKLLAVGMILAGAFMLSGCTSRDEGLVGVWYWSENPAYVTTFNADGTGTHARDWGFGYGTTFNWSTPGNDIIWNYPNHPNLRTPYTLSGDTLHMTLVGGTVTYHRRR